MAEFEIDIAIVLTQLFVLLLLARVMAAIFTRLKMPALVGEIIAGIIVANWIWLYDILQIDLDKTTVLYTFSELGVIFLLFTVGLETKFSDLSKVGKVASKVAILGVVFPLIFGYIVLYAWPLGAHSQVECLFMGAAMVATSVGITARVLKDMNVQNSKESKIILGAAVIDDILGMIILAIVAGIGGSSSGGIDMISVVTVAVLAFLFVGLIFLFGAKAIPKVRARLPKDEAGCPVLPKSEAWTAFSLSLLVCFGLAAIADLIGLAAIIGAFMAGMIFAEFDDMHQLENKFDPVNEFLVPFFFVMTGMYVSFSMVSSGVLWMSIAIIAVAVVAKYLPCRLGARSLGKGVAKRIGIGMVPRGEVGIIVASIGYAGGTGPVSLDIYTVVVLMSIMTSIIAPFWLSRSFRRDIKMDKDVSI